MTDLLMVGRGIDRGQQAAALLLANPGMSASGAYRAQRTWLQCRVQTVAGDPRLKVVCTLRLVHTRVSFLF